VRQHIYLFFLLNSEKGDYFKHIPPHEVWAETQCEPSNNPYRFERYQAFDEGDWQ
jgi:hypothetical protein